MAFGIITIVIYCAMNSMPHFLYGPGDDALALTVEHGAVRDDEQTKVAQDVNNKKLVCQANSIVVKNSKPNMFLIKAHFSD